MVADGQPRRRFPASRQRGSKLLRYAGSRDCPVFPSTKPSRSTARGANAATTSDVRALENPRHNHVERHITKWIPQNGAVGHQPAMRRYPTDLIIVQRGEQCQQASQRIGFVDGLRSALLAQALVEQHAIRIDGGKRIAPYRYAARVQIGPAAHVSQNRARILKPLPQRRASKHQLGSRQAYRGWTAHRGPCNFSRTADIGHANRHTALQQRGQLGPSFGKKCFLATLRQRQHHRKSPGSIARLDQQQRDADSGICVQCDRFHREAGKRSCPDFMRGDDRVRLDFSQLLPHCRAQLLEALGRGKRCTTVALLSLGWLAPM
jgi:hypothetical protein